MIAPIYFDLGYTFAELEPENVTFTCGCKCVKIIKSLNVDAHVELCPEHEDIKIKLDNGEISKGLIKNTVITI